MAPLIPGNNAFSPIPISLHIYTVCRRYPLPPSPPLHSPSLPSLPPSPPCLIPRPHGGGGGPRRCGPPPPRAPRQAAPDLHVIYKTIPEVEQMFNGVETFLRLFIRWV